MVNRIYSKFKKSLKYINFIRSSKFFRTTGTKRKYPKGIQFPITYQCNAKCIMCNIWKMDYSNELTVEELSNWVKDPLFKEVESVGINGGEPSLVKNLTLFVEQIVKLPKLKKLNIISHGFSQKLLLNHLKEIYLITKRNNIKLSVSISLDGIENIHNIVRGKNNVYAKTVDTIEKISNNPNKYCDSLDLACTITMKNVDNLVELEKYIKDKNYVMKYRLAISNKRIESYKILNDFSLIQNNSRQSASEFFYKQLKKSTNLFEKFRNYAIFYYLTEKKSTRLLGCKWKDEGVTVDSRGDLYYCAVESDKLGSLREKSGEKIFFDTQNINYRKKIIDNKCDECIHDYSGPIQTKNILIFYKYLFNEYFSYKIYKLRIKWGLF